MLKIPERPTRRLLESIYARPYVWFFGALALSMAMVQAGRGLSLKSKLEDLLPNSSPSVIASEELKERLESVDSLVVTLMTDNFNQVKPALSKIANAITALPEVRFVEYKLDLELINRDAMIIFPSVDDLKEYYDELTDAIKTAVKSRLDLFDDEEEEGEDNDEDEPQHTWKWAELEDEHALSRVGRRFREEQSKYKEYFYNKKYTTLGLQVFPTKPSSDLNFSRQLLKVVDATVREAVAAELGPIGPGQTVTRVDLGGGYRGAIEESNAIKDDLISSSTFSFGLLALVLIVFFRSVRALFCVMIPLVMGTMWTVGLVALTVGYLNLITAFIFAVLLGLGIDFGIHFYSRYREERASGADPLEAMVATHIQCGEASLLAAITTSASFVVLMLADFRGFSQFGGVAAAGVLLCLVAVAVVFPAVAFIFERWAPLKLLGYRVDRDESGGIKRRRFPVGAGFLAGAIAVSLGALVLSPAHIDFEYDFRQLGRKAKKSKQYEDIQYGTTQATSPAVLLAKSSEEARHFYDQLEARTEAVEKHPRIKSFQSLFSLVPMQQDEKRKWVGKLCRKLRRKHKLFDGDRYEGAQVILGHCEPGEITTENLPAWVKRQFTDKRGRLGEFIYVSPRGSINDGKVALAFREEMISLEDLSGKPPVVSGKPMVWAEVLIAMKEDGLRIAIASLGAVLLLLFVFERRFVAVGIILLPLFCTAAVMAAAMALFDLKLNFFNMLAVPTIIGMGVDDGVHMYHRYKELGRGSIVYIVRTTGMAAFLTTLTTSIGFGSLIAANHKGLNSLGELTVIGMIGALVATLVVLPAALAWRESRQAAV